MKGKCSLILILSMFFIGCGHTQSSKVGLLSFGDLEGKVLPESNVPESVIVSGRVCGIPITHVYQRLSEAVLDALQGTEYDTLIDAEVINQTGFLVSDNCLMVKGTALNSKKLNTPGGK